MGFCFPRITDGLIRFFVGGGTFLRKVYGEKIFPYILGISENVRYEEFRVYYLYYQKFLYLFIR